MLLQHPHQCGVGQTGLIYGCLNYVINGVLITNTIRFHDYHFIVTAPDGTSQTYDFPYVADSTSAQYFAYTPLQVGVYNITFLFPGQTYDFGDSYKETTIHLLTHHTYGQYKKTQ